MPGSAVSMARHSGCDQFAATTAVAAALELRARATRLFAARRLAEARFLEVSIASVSSSARAIRLPFVRVNAYLCCLTPIGLFCTSARGAQNDCGVRRLNTAPYGARARPLGRVSTARSMNRLRRAGPCAGHSGGWARTTLRVNAARWTRHARRVLSTKCNKGATLTSRAPAHIQPALAQPDWLTTTRT
jgi:hypothetical protein